MELHEIAEKHPHLTKRIESMQKSEKTAKLLLDVAEMAGTQVLLDHLRKMIEGVNETLLYEPKLTELERAILIKERDCWEWLISQFANQKGVLARIEDFRKKYD